MRRHSPTPRNDDLWYPLMVPPTACIKRHPPTPRYVCVWGRGCVCVWVFVCMCVSLVNFAIVCEIVSPYVAKLKGNDVSVSFTKSRLKLQVSFAKEPYERDYILHKRPIT